MSEHNEVRHEGVITSIDGDMAQVTILVKSACAECHIKGACSLSEIQAKVIEVNLKGQTFRIGDKVNVALKESLGMRAVLLAYIIPVLLIISTLLIAGLFIDNENIIAGSSLLIAGIYYLFLYLNKRMLKKSFQFRIE
ncbi:MAG: SoxR reducing system RseC family protein [Sphingobacteriales bacterium]|nr:SoxR reducing system RseC family protein [Sphingobacteriales bacterium]